MRLLIAAVEIPEGETVTKRTGEVKYTLRGAVRVFGEGGEPREIKAQDGACFIVSNKGDINAIPGTTLLLWHVEESNLLSWLEARVYEAER